MIASCFCTFVSAEYANPDTDKISIVANRTKVKVGDIITVAYYLPENVSISYCDIGAKFDETKLEYVNNPPSQARGTAQHQVIKRGNVFLSRLLFIKSSPEKV